VPGRLLHAVALGRLNFAHEADGALGGDGRERDRGVRVRVRVTPAESAAAGAAIAEEGSIGSIARRAKSGVLYSSILLEEYRE